MTIATLRSMGSLIGGEEVEVAKEKATVGVSVNDIAGRNEVLVMDR